MISFVETKQQIEDRRLASTGWADDAEELARFDREGQIGESKASVVVEADAIEGHARYALSERLARVLEHFDLPSDQIVDQLDRSVCALGSRIGCEHAPERLIRSWSEGHKGYEGPDGGCAVEDLESAVAEDDAVDEISDDVIGERHKHMM